MIYLITLLAAFCRASPAGAQAPSATSLPTFVAPSSNINDFGRFADGGPDENWYVGFNNAWIVQLPPAPIGEYTRAFIGAKLGRAKSRPRQNRPWEREIIHGKIYIAISPVPSFSPERSFFLVETKDIPFEPDPRVYMPGAGQSQWFWAEVPLGRVNFSGPNYLITWSPTEELAAAAGSPILAALEAHGSSHNGGARAWVNRSIQGVPPRKTAGALETPIHTLSPALAIKLVRPNEGTVGVAECSARPMARGILFGFSVDAENADLAWVERSRDRLDWERVSRYLRQPPYLATVPYDLLGARGAFLRATARDLLGNEASCDAQFVANTSGEQ